MKCPCCGKAKLIADTRDLPYTYKNESTVIQNVNGLFCSACGEGLFNAKESKRISAEMLEFNKQVEALVVEPTFIARVRKKLHLNQSEASKLFGGGINAFSRYEKGRTKPPLSLIKLFQILDGHPDLLKEIA
jgi:HTH-type transcriptional regulator / antitoxin MqsA